MEFGEEEEREDGDKRVKRNVAFGGRIRIYDTLPNSTPNSISFPQLTTLTPRV